MQSKISLNETEAKKSETRLKPGAVLIIPACTNYRGRRDWVSERIIMCRWSGWQGRDSGRGWYWSRRQYFWSSHHCPSNRKLLPLLLFVVLLKIQLIMKQNLCPGTCHLLLFCSSPPLQLPGWGSLICISNFLIWSSWVLRSSSLVPLQRFSTGASFGAPLPGVGGCVVGLALFALWKRFHVLWRSPVQLEAVEGLFLLLHWTGPV